MASDLTPDAPDIGDWLARMAPPDTPAEAEELCPELNEFTINLDPMRSAAVLAGLMTDSRFQANHIRIDFAMRLVLARGCGKRKVGHDALDRLLNHALVEARVASLEDPIEDFFTDVLPTMHGDMLLFTGLWEKAASHTECLLRAFTVLPAWGGQGSAIERAYALLRLSDALVHRSGLDRRVIGPERANQPSSCHPTSASKYLRREYGSDMGTSGTFEFMTSIWSPSCSHPNRRDLWVRPFRAIPPLRLDRYCR